MSDEVQENQSTLLSAERKESNGHIVESNDEPVDTNANGGEQDVGEGPEKGTPENEATMEGKDISNTSDNADNADNADNGNNADNANNAANVDNADDAENADTAVTSSPSPKGKGKAIQDVTHPIDPTTSSHPVEDRSVAPTPEPPAHVRYQLPIGGPPSKRRLKQRMSNNSGSVAGPSGSKSNASVRINDPEGTLSRASTIKAKRRMPTRRMSSSDIPRIPDESFDVGIAGRRRSNTLVVRGEKVPFKGKRDKSIRPKSAASLPDSIPRKHRSTLMIDGQIFTLDEDLKRYQPRSQSLRARSDTVTTATTTHDSHNSRPYVPQNIKNPVSSKLEPMIYDAEELDDIPPPGSYAIHPPSQRRLAEAAELRLYNEDGDLVRFGKLFENQRTLVIFLRHWFCPFCQMFAQSIQKIDPLPLQRADLGMIVIGQGHWHVSKSYKEVMKMPSFVRIFSDPTRKIYSALGMTLRTNDAGPACSRPDYQTMGALKASMVAIKKGVVDMPIRLPGDVKLLGGEFILGPGLQCSFTHRMVTTRGHLDLPRILLQAGCDLSLKTPKDVLAEGDATPRKPGSTRSVDRRTARRIARKIGVKGRKDILLSKTRKAADEAAAGQGTASRTKFGNRAVPSSPLSRRFVHSGVSQDEFDDEQPTLTDRYKQKIVEGMQTGLSVTAGATMYAAEKAIQAATSVTQTNNANPAAAAPPLPPTSSEDAFQAANARQKSFNEADFVNLESNGAMYAGSTLSLGRQGNGKLGEEDVKAIMGRSTFSSPDLHAAQLTSMDGEYVTPIYPRPRPSAKNPLRPTSSSSSIGAASKAPPAESSTAQEPVPRGTSTGVPLSLFERRFLGGKPRGPGHVYSQSTDYSKISDLKPVVTSPRYSLQNDARTPLSATFGEDTDYKRLSRAELEKSAAERTLESVPNDTQAKPKRSMDAATTTSRNEDLGEKTPKGRIISLYADDFNANGRDSFDVPPPLPPKSPRHGLPTSESRTSLLSNAPMPDRAPVPAPTPAFAAILAAEEARRSGSVPPTPTAVPKAELYTNEEKNQQPSLTSTTSTRPMSGLHSGASPALFAGLPSLNGSSTSLSRSQSQPIKQIQAQPQSRPQSQPQTQPQPPSQPTTQSQTQPPSLAQPPPISPFGTFSGNPLQMAALSGANGGGHSRNASASSVTSTERAAATAAAANAMPRELVKPSKTTTGSSFLEDLEPMDGLNRTSNSQDSNLLLSPSSGRETSSSVDYEEDTDEEDYRGDWGPLQARQNLISSSQTSSHRGHDTIKEEEDEDWTENETDDGDLEDVDEEMIDSQDSAPQLALFSGFTKAKKLAAPNSFVVKRVTSRPSTAPGKMDESADSTTTNSASARKIPISRLLRKPPKTAPSNAGRRLSSMAEEEEELEENSTIDSSTRDSNAPITIE